MNNLTAILDNIQKNLPTILNGVTIALSLFLLWLLVSQIVILSQGWELYQGTAGRMEGGGTEPPTAETANEAVA